MIVKMNDEAIKAVEDAMRRGKDAVVHRYKDGLIVEEQEIKTRKKVIYSSYPIAGRE